MTPETEDEWGMARLTWWLRLTDEQRARYDALRDVEDDDLDGQRE